MERLVADRLQQITSPALGQIGHELATGRTPIGRAPLQLVADGIEIFVAILEDARHAKDVRPVDRRRNDLRVPAAHRREFVRQRRHELHDRRKVVEHGELRRLGHMPVQIVRHAVTGIGPQQFPFAETRLRTLRRTLGPRVVQQGLAAQIPLETGVPLSEELGLEPIRRLFGIIAR